jgi:DNA sulfur modification protein DndD
LILDQIKLTNFGIYKGEHSVSLTPKNKKPIILFGAYNGSGKTTLLEGLQLVLYGKLAKTAGRGKQPYEQYLSSLINNKVSKKQGAGISLNFRTREGGKETAIEITRTWQEATSGIKENFEVIKNGVFDPISSERWGEFVEEFMPSEISELFFFDGEKIEGLADPISSSSMLKSGIYSLLGINSIDNLIKSLSQIEKRKALEIANKDDKSSIENEEALAKTLSNKLSAIESEAGSLRTELDIVENKITKIEGEMKVSGADLLIKRHQLQEKLATLTEKKKALNNELIELASGLAPLLTTRNLITNLRKKIQDGSGHNQKTFEITQKEFKLLENSFSKQVNDHNFSSILKKLISNRIQEIDIESKSSLNDISLSEIPTDEEMDGCLTTIKTKLSDLEKVNFELETTNKNLHAVPAEEKVKHLIESLNSLRSEKIKLETKIAIVNENQSSAKAELEKISKILTNKFSEIASRTSATKIGERILSHTQKSRNTLLKFKEALIGSHIESLGNSITACFQSLHRKKDLNLRFNIQPSDFSLHIITNDGQEMPSSKLSAGERQLLAVAILWALAKSSGKTLPTVIDTPLGRLDGPHREKLIKNYFPMASSQVLIFSTDEEVNEKYYKALKPHISAEYKINYDEKSQSSSFEEGYF